MCFKKFDLDFETKQSKEQSVKYKLQTMSLLDIQQVIQSTEFHT